MKNRAVLSFLLAVFFLAACSVEPPKASIENVRLVNATFDKVKTEITLKIENPNSFAIRIREVRYTLSINGEKIANDRLTKKIDLPANGKTTVTLPIGFSPMKAAGAGLDAFTKRRVNYRAEAEIVVDTKLGKITVPVSETGVFSF